MPENNTKLNLSAEQITLAAYVQCFLSTVDGLIKDSGHEPIMAKVESKMMKSLLVLFAVTKDPEDLYKPMATIYKALPSYNKNKLSYLKIPFKAGMVIARQIIEVEEPSESKK